MSAIYDEKFARALRESGEREGAARREGIRTASRCAWCQCPIGAHDPRCLDATVTTELSSTHSTL